MPKRSDRLYDLIQVLRDGRLHRGRDLAQRLGVSLRTLYRDMDTLIASRIPIEGERGLGYMMTAPITLPPLNLTLQELEALHLGLSVVAKASDKAIKDAADTLAAKIDAVLPEDRSAPAADLGFAVYPFEDAARGFVHMAPLRAAIRSRRKVQITYRAVDDARTEQSLRPLQIEYWGRIWTLTAWSEDQGAFHVFRVDRIETLDVSFDTFDDEPGKALADHLKRLDSNPGL
ncbi:YafY family transcriptional regulator [Rhodobacteraceae bacterium]|nr:YafY family transcriptional regulator [Paracoccaceae bacterium]